MKTVPPPFLLEVCIIFKTILGVLGFYILCAASVSAEDALPTIQFSIKPHLCVLSEGEELCEDELEIRWTSPSRRSLCLFRNDVARPLECWEDTVSGHHYINIAASHNVDFQLKEVGNEELVVTEAFEVVHENPQFRRRRRNAWSFF